MGMMVKHCQVCHVSNEDQFLAYSHDGKLVCDECNMEIEAKRKGVSVNPVTYEQFREEFIKFG